MRMWFTIGIWFAHDIRMMGANYSTSLANHLCTLHRIGEAKKNETYSDFVRFYLRYECFGHFLSIRMWNEMVIIFSSRNLNQSRKLSKTTTKMLAINIIIISASLISDFMKKERLESRKPAKFYYMERILPCECLLWCLAIGFDSSSDNSRNGEDRENKTTISLWHCNLLT